MLDLARWRTRARHHAFVSLVLANGGSVSETHHSMSHQAGLEGLARVDRF